MEFGRKGRYLGVKWTELSHWGGRKGVNKNDAESHNYSKLKNKTKQGTLRRTKIGSGIEGEFGVECESSADSPEELMKRQVETEDKLWELSGLCPEISKQET